jgi:glutamate-ammonia-ligase adenylyltransferase
VSATRPTRPEGLTAAVERSAAPAEVGAAVDRLLEQRPELADGLAEPHCRDALVAVLGASRSLTRLVEAEPRAVEVLSSLDERRAPAGGDVDDLVRTKQLELLRIAARDLTGRDDLDTTAANLAALAVDVLAEACRLRGTSGLTVVGMGKLGGVELNYSSDIDVVFVGDGDHADLVRQAKGVVDVAGRCFRVDTNLRPEGRNGPLVRSLDSYRTYWERWAEPWELQALLKAVPVSGDTGLGRAFEGAAGELLWGHPFAAEDLRQLREMKARTEAEVARRGETERDLKRAPGGIRDIEFTVQLLQLVHGHLDPAIRQRSTMVVLAELAEAGYVDDDDADRLARAYRFLRTVEHRLQLLDDQQVHALPRDRAVLDRVARTLGLRDTPRATAPDALLQMVRQERLAVRSIHERIYFRPLLEAFSASDEHRLSPEAAVARLTAFGFTDADRTQEAVRELTRGLNRTSRLMQQMLPLLLDWLSSSPDPEQGLVALRNLLSGSRRTALLTEAFRESPEAARALCRLVGTSRLLASVIGHEPDLVERLPFPDQLRTRTRDELVASATAAVAWRPEPSSRQEGLRRWKDRHLLGIAARDVLGHTPEIADIGQDLATVAEAAVEVALTALEPRVPFAVLALGRFGGAELSFASDLDLVFVHGGSGAGAAEEAQRLATGLRRSLHGATPASRLYEVDLDLRPEGRDGPLSRSIEGYVRYWQHYALVWERQAMSRARPVAGDLGLGAELLDLLEPHVWGPGLDRAAETEVRRMKARLETERLPAGEDPRFHLKLGKGSLSDIEWTAQLLQLRHRIHAPGTWAALAALEEAGVLDPDDAEVLRDSYRYCERTRNRWYLVSARPGDALPTALDDLLHLARSLGTTPSELRETYRRVTRRARKVVERVFYEVT